MLLLQQILIDAQDLLDPTFVRVAKSRRTRLMPIEYGPLPALSEYQRKLRVRYVLSTCLQRCIRVCSAEQTTEMLLQPYGIGHMRYGSPLNRLFLSITGVVLFLGFHATAGVTTALQTPKQCSPVTCRYDSISDLQATFMDVSLTVQPIPEACKMLCGYVLEPNCSMVCMHINLALSSCNG